MSFQNLDRGSDVDLLISQLVQKPDLTRRALAWAMDINLHNVFAAECIPSLWQ
jgi:hypothetical protein